MAPTPGTRRHRPAQLTLDLRRLRGLAIVVLLMTAGARAPADDRPPPGPPAGRDSALTGNEAYHRLLDDAFGVAWQRYSAAEAPNPAGSLLIALKARDHAMEQGLDSPHSWEERLQRSRRSVIRCVGGLPSSTIFDDACFSPDSSRLFAAARDGTVVVWDLRTGRETHSWKAHQFGTRRVSQSPDGTVLISAGGKPSLAFWDADTGQPRGKPIDDLPAIWDFALDPAGTTLVTGHMNGAIKVWDTGRRVMLREFTCGNPPSNNIVSLVFSPDGAFLFAGGSDGHVHVWEAAKWKEVVSWQADKKGLKSLALSPDGRALITQGDEGTIKRWTPVSGELIWEQTVDRGGSSRLAMSADGRSLFRDTEGGLERRDLDLGEVRESWDAEVPRPFRLACSPDGSALVSLSFQTPVVLWDTRQGRVRARLPRRGASGTESRLSPDGSRLACWGRNLEGVSLWDTTTGEFLCNLASGDRNVRDVVFDPEGRRLATGAEDGTIRLWNVEGLKEEGQMARRKHASCCLSFSPDGRTLASGENTGEITLWDVERHEELQRLEGGHSGVESVGFSPDGTLLAAGTGTGQIYIWNIAAETEKMLREGDSGGAVTQVAFSPDGTRLLSVGFHSTVRLWDLATDETETVLLDGEGAAVAASGFSPGGNLVVTETGGVLRIWEVGRRNPRKTVVWPGQKLSSVSFTAEGIVLASNSIGGGNFRVWVVPPIDPEPKLDGHEGMVNALAFAEGGDCLVSGGEDGQVKIWDVDTRAEIARLPGPGKPVLCLASSPGGDQVACGRRDGTLEVIELPEAKCRPVPFEDGVTVTVLAYDPSGLLLASGSAGDAAFLWDVASGKLRARLPGHGERVASLAFSGKGDVLCTCGDNGEVIVWETATGKEIGRWSAPGGRPTALAFRPGPESLLACADEAGRVSFRRLPSGSETFGPFRLPGAFVAPWRCLVFEPDGRRVRALDQYGNLGCWDTASRALLSWGKISEDAPSSFSMEDLKRRPNGALAVSPNGDWIAASFLRSAISLRANPETMTLAMEEAERLTGCALNEFEVESLPSHRFRAPCHLVPAEENPPKQPEGSVTPPLSSLGMQWPREFPQRWAPGARQADAESAYRLAVIREREGRMVEARELHLKLAARADAAAAPWRDRSLRRLERMPWLREK